MPKSVELYKDVLEEDGVDMEDTKMASAAPPGIGIIPTPSSNPKPKNVIKNDNDFMEQVKAIQNKQLKPSPRPTISSTPRSRPEETIKPKPPKPTKSIKSIKPTRTPKPTILINEETIESFGMPSASSLIPSNHSNVLKVIFLGLLFYVLGNARTIKYTNSLHISSRVDSLVIHAIIFGLLSYVILVI